MSTILSIKNITKTYPGVVALDNASIDIEEGEIHALIGENGAGKSTLIKTITGAIKPDSGEIIYKGSSYSEMNPVLTRSLGIEAIYQEFNLAPSLTVAENIFLGSKVDNSPILDRKKLNKEAQKVLSIFNMDISPRTEVRDLSVACMQLVEIAKAVARNAKLLIMDEPTAPLTDNEVDALFGLVNELKKQGVTIIYISHRLEELFRITDKVTVMRDGKVITTRVTKDFTKDELIYQMVGRELKETFPPRNVTYGDVILEVKNMCSPDVDNISFKLHKGEVLGLAGLVGAGRTELARLIFGADPKDSGEVYIDGQKAEIKSPKQAVKYGIGLVAEDRKAQGVLLKMSIRWNITIPILKELSNGLVINKKKENECVEKYKQSLNIKAPSAEQTVGNLSGGNQQKVALGKWLASDTKILIFDEPTRGIDVGAKQEIYQLINTLAKQGVGIIIISSEMEEILGMSDRLIVLAEGRQTGALEKDEFSQTTVLKYASGEI